MHLRNRRFLAVTSLLLLGLLSLPSASLAEPARLRLGSDIWPPFTDQEGRRRVAIDLVREALERSSRGIEIQSIILPEAHEITDRLKAGTIDGSAAFWHTPERESYLFYSQPYLENRLVLLARKGTDVSATSWKDLADRKVGIVAGYAYTERQDLALEISEEVQGAAPNLVASTNDQENLQRLLRGDIDFMLADELIVHEFFERHGEPARTLLAAGTTPLIERSLHFVVRRNYPDAAQIVKDFDDAIREMIADGTFNDALGLVWLRADLNGDGETELILGGTRAGTQAPADGYVVFSGESDQKTAKSNPTLVIDGKHYQEWSEVPSEFKRPVERNEAWPEPTIRLLKF